MNLTSVLRFSRSGVEFLRVAWLVLAGILGLIGTAQAADPNPATNEIVFPKSLFVSNDVRGKDPFFPNRSRTGLSTVVTNISATPAPNLNELQLRGITGTPERRIALINNLTFEKGEENEVRISNGKIKIKVLEIRDKSVLIQIEGRAEPKELLLPERLLRLNE